MTYLARRRPEGGSVGGTDGQAGTGLCATAGATYSLDMARLVLIRHAPTAETGRRLTGRIRGVPLDDGGRTAAQVTSEWLAPVRFRAVYASPLERTWETAEIVARPHRLAPVAHDGLLEVDYGDWSGRTLGSLYKLKAWRSVVMTPSRVTFPGGETLLAAQRRAVAACEELAGRHRDDTIALVSHSDIIRLVVSHYLGQPLDLFHRIAVAPASVTTLVLPRQGMPILESLNALPGVAG